MGARSKGTYLRFIVKVTAQRREMKRLRAALRRRDQQIAHLKAQNEQLTKKLQPTKVAGHRYPAEMIALAIFMVTHANASLRCAAKTVGYMAMLLGWDYDTPAHGTIDNWKRRLGLYVLDYGKAKVGRYVTIFDESIQIGCEKFMLLLGVKLPEESSHFAPLTFTDVEVLGVEVRRSWKGDEVEEFTRRRLAHHSDVKVEYMVSDQGSNLRQATDNMGLSTVADCSHIIMNALKKILANHPVLSRLTKFMGQYRRVNILSERSHLCPATLRDKDRFLRLFTILDWTDRLASWWSFLPADHRQTLSILQDEEIKDFLLQLAELRRIVKQATALLKTSGLNERSQQLWLATVAEIAPTGMALELANIITAYYASYVEVWTKHGGRLFCCSDIIESIFGRYKNKGGMKAITADVLGVALYGQSIDVEFVCRGLSTVSQQHIVDFHFEHTCDNRFSIIRRLNEQAKMGTDAA